jgi:hypothetical protein
VEARACLPNGSFRHRSAMDDISTSDYSISEAEFGSVHRPNSVENLLAALVGGACDEEIRPLSPNV